APGSSSGSGYSRISKGLFGPTKTAARPVVVMDLLSTLRAPRLRGEWSALTEREERQARHAHREREHATQRSDEARPSIPAADASKASPFGNSSPSCRSTSSPLPGSKA